MDNYEFYVSTNLEKYVGQWIAVVDGKVVSHGGNAKRVYDESRKAHPGKTPFLTCIPTAMMRNCS